MQSAALHVRHGLRGESHMLTTSLRWKLHGGLSLRRVFLSLILSVPAAVMAGGSTILRAVIPILASTSVTFATSAALTVARAGSPTYITFDIPGQGTGDFRGAVPISIAPDGTVTGYMTDASDVRHGFVRTPRGTFTIFDAPNAGTGVRQGTHGYSIAPNGTISGWYFDAYSVAHALVRTPEGVITVVDIPGSGNGEFQGTFSWWPAITPSGVITGYIVDENYVNHGFIRDLEGGFTVFDVPEASEAGGGTQAFAISVPGVVTGNYFDSSGIGHGFIRSKDGSITTFDVAGAAGGTFPGAISPSGAISGSYVDGSGTPHCFVRARGGTLTTIDAPPYASPGSSCVSALIAPDGTVAATYVDGTTGNDHAFLRDAKGTITNIDVPGPLAVNGTFASSIGADGVVVGNCADSNLTVHGFVRMP